MGGASRSEKKRQQEAAAKRLAEGGGAPRGNRTPLVVVAAVLVVAVAVGLTVWVVRGSGPPVVPDYQVSATGAVVTAGTPSAPVPIDVYEDYLCPGCAAFEEGYGEELTTALNNGQVVVRRHTIAILDNRTDPPGYSTRAANAALCAVPAGIFPTYHATLFAEGPAEGGAGLTDDELIALGVERGATGDFAGCVRAARSAAAVAAETLAAENNPALRTDGQFRTPTVTVDGRKIDVNDGGWLADALAATAR